MNIPIFKGFAIMLLLLTSILAQAQYQWPFPNPNQQGSVIGAVGESGKLQRSACRTLDRRGICNAPESESLNRLFNKKSSEYFRGFFLKFNLLRILFLHLIPPALAACLPIRT